MSYGIDGYIDWNNNPIGGGCGYQHQLSGTPINPSDLRTKLGIPNNFVYVDQDINLTYETTPIPIAAGVTLCSNRGNGGAEGALLYTRDQNLPALFKITGPGVLIKGLRFGGYDHANPYSFNPNDVNDYYYPPVPNKPSCAIYCDQSDFQMVNCELNGWTEAALKFDNHNEAPITSIYIHHCYIHHNQHPNYGYGIEMISCEANIEANIFDYNMFSIIGSLLGVFWAQYNLILPNAKGTAFYFDCTLSANLSDINIYHNSFWLRSNSAIYIDGKPNIGADIFLNRFAEPIDTNAIIPYSDNYNYPNNVYGEYVSNSDYGIEAYTDWYNVGPLGGGCGYYQPLIPNYPHKHPHKPYHIYAYNLQTLFEALTSKWALNYKDIDGNLWCLIEFINNTDLAHIDYSPEIKFFQNTPMPLPPFPSSNLRLESQKNLFQINNYSFPFKIPANTILYGHRGDGDCEGALLYTTDKDLVTPHHTLDTLFNITGKNVRITGLRIAGGYQARPNPPSSSTVPYGANGIYTAYSDQEVDNCELYGWPHTPLRFSGGTDASGNPNPQLQNIRIHHNYIHHNQQNGGGYGMTGDNCYYTVYANIFDYNWDAIAGTGKPGTSYEAKWNLFLNNSYSRVLDMHPYPNPTDPNGTCGEEILIHHNSFWLWNKTAIGFEIPSSLDDKIYRNFFPQKLPQGQDPNSNNVYINTLGYDAPTPPNTIYDNKYGI